MEGKESMEDFFRQQLRDWQLAAKNYADLKSVETRDVGVSCGALVRVQFNPARMVSTGAKTDKAALAKRPCFLCKKNRPARQREVSMDGFELLVNPFPILPEHYTMPRTSHDMQRIDPYFSVMLDVAEMHPDYCVFYNGPKCGASAPDHMHFQVGRTADVPFFAQWEKAGSPCGFVDFWPGTCVVIAGSRDEVEREFRRLYDSLPVPIGETEPMFNVFARYAYGTAKDELNSCSGKRQADFSQAQGNSGADAPNVGAIDGKGQLQVVVFVRSQHRPACYGSGVGQRMVSPGALDMAGLLITPRKEDYATLSAEDIESLYAEVSSPVMRDYIEYVQNAKGRMIAVGLVETDEEIEYTLNGDFKSISLLGEKIYIPQSDNATFTIKNMLIGINFHWQQKRELTYSGMLRIAKTPEGKNVAINILPIEDYLKSVISSEMSAMSDKELLKAHAILSRSWLIANIEGVHQNKTTDEEGLVWYDRSAHAHYDVCADDHCQRYQGLTMQTSEIVNEAVEETRGMVLEYDGKICDARFSKCCGGRTEEYKYCWDEAEHPYLVSVDCPYCNTSQQFDTEEEEQKVLGQVLNDYDLKTRNFFRWTATYTNPDIREIIPIERGKSGRIWKLKLVHDDGKEETVGKELEIRRRLSDTHLFSSMFSVEKDVNAEGDTFRLTGQGWGHGVGLCQIGAAVMAAKGFTYEQILKHYFPKSVIGKQI